MIITNQEMTALATFGQQIFIIGFLLFNRQVTLEA